MPFPTGLLCVYTGRDKIPIKNGLYRIIWRCSYSSETERPMQISIGFCTRFIGLGLGIRQCDRTLTIM